MQINTVEKPARYLIAEVDEWGSENKMTKNTNNNNLVQEKIQEILDQCPTGNYIFRGESKKHEKVSSGLYRQYWEPDDSTPLIDNDHFSVFTVEKDIVEKVKRHLRPDAPNIEVLTELQHYGGKTTLLDFSKDIHIALFFACDGNFNEDGRVIFCKKSNFTEAPDIDYEKLEREQGEHIYTLISPTGKSPRVIFQSSIFVHVSRGYLEDDKYEVITIEENLKEPLLEYLSKHFNIRAETIYNDIQGFIRNQHNHSTAEIEFYRGYTNAALGQYKESIADYDKAIALNPKNAEIYYNRGNTNSSLDKHEEAIKDYNKAIELNEKHSEAYNNRGKINSILHKNSAALQDYNKAIELNPRNAASHYNRGLANVALGQHKQAIEDYSKAIELNPQHTKAYNNRGAANAALCQHEEAIKDYTKAIELNPQNVEAYNSRGLANLALKKYDEGIKDYTRGIEFNPNNVGAYLSLGSIKYTIGRYEEAIRDYDKAIEINPNHIVVYDSRGLAKSALKMYEEAIKDYTKAIEIDPQQDYIYCDRGSTHYALGKHKEAIKDYDKARECYNKAKADYSKATILSEKEGNIEMVEKCESSIARLNELLSDE